MPTKKSATATPLRPVAMTTPQPTGEVVIVAPGAALAATPEQLDRMDALLAAPIAAPEQAPEVVAPEVAPVAPDPMAQLLAMVAALAAEVTALKQAPSAAPVAQLASDVAPVQPRNVRPRAADLSAADKDVALRKLEAELSAAKAARDTKQAKKIRGRMRDLGYYRSAEGKYE